ncbi:hypothetical protein ABB37_03595 [Leptomonas pyrrhocoris]|uniref:Mediator of DNA damage checkpoint protein 1 n=1 Tax=Leptomonas pyrrhocoris TaxID=157538 RepID=A0A0M9G529_LEPPY|nr:hypothetical protein ABB37_03595 [Leptomonas pyrrhocoris]KPA82560.1 hypothetical protein ABB37_03595 [Leptomonas pyrrhocoris]|eukprot:XP_015660999.1 hypothetical protein ABB37_03595 [Leptomonas pyrrhocoris]
MITASATAYALVAQEKQYPLQIGKNVVGRSNVPVEGVSFINLESPLAAISRMQAFVDVAANGDAWVSDCNSTNGTFLSVRPGPGVRLETNRYYQLTPGCRIVFGDVECTFEALGSTPHTPERTTASPASSAARASRKTERIDVIGASTDSIGKAPRSKREDNWKAPHTDDTKVHRGDIPYLDESVSFSQDHNGVAAASPAEKEKGRNTANRSSPAASSSPAPAKKGKKETATGSSPSRAKETKSSPQSAGQTAGPPVVCLTGMDSDERTAITKRVRQLKGRVVEDITKANLLVVATPPVRTPKFIIAVARGVPVVSVRYICNDQAELEDARRHIVGLKTPQHTYTAAALEKVIYRKDHRPLLKGVRVNVSALSSKTKGVATEIITASGGEVDRTKKGDALHVTDDRLDALYDSILRGKVPQSL